MAAMVFNDRKLRAMPRPTKEEGQRTYVEKQGVAAAGCRSC